MNRIEELIKEKGYNMTSFSEKMGITRQNLYSILKNPSYPSLEKLAKTLNVPMWQLFASPEEILSTSEGGHKIRCPKCGHEFRVGITVEKAE